MRRSGVRIPLAPPQADIRSRMSVFCMPGRVRAVPGAVLLVAPLVFRAPSGPAAREIATREPAARSGRSRSPPVPSGPSGALHTGGAVLLCVAWRVGSKPGQALPPPTGTAAVPCRRPPAPPPPTGMGGNSRETVITFAGVCSVSGETDDTIASQIPPFSAQFWRAKASWVSWRRPDVPALVPTVSFRGAVSSMGVTKFAQLRLSMAIAPKHSPSAGKMAQHGRL